MERVFMVPWLLSKQQNQNHALATTIRPRTRDSAADHVAGIHLCLAFR